MRIPTLADSLHASYGRSRSELYDPSGRRKCHSDGDMNALGSSRRIQFDRVEIREYNRQIGDNPSCSGGPPIGLSWEYNPEIEALPVEHYEETRGPRRTSKQMAMPRSVREEILKNEWGTKQSEIASAVRENFRIKNSRRRTVMNLESPMTKVEEKMEGVKKGLKKSLRLRKSFRNQYKEWQTQAEEAALLSDRLEAEAAIAEENEAAQAEAEAEAKRATNAILMEHSSASAADVSAGLHKMHPVVVISEEEESNPAATPPTDQEPFEGALQEWSFLATGEHSSVPQKSLDLSQSSGAPTSEKDCSSSIRFAPRHIMKTEQPKSFNSKSA